MSRKLKERLEVKVYHLDDLFWEADWKPKSPRDWMEIQKQLVNNKAFIIDGNYLKTLEFRINHADTIIYMDKGLIKCLYGVTKRTVKNFIGKDMDLPQKVMEQDKKKINESGLLKFYIYIISFHLKQKKELNQLLSKYEESKQIIRLKTKKDMLNFLENEGNSRFQ